MSEENNASSNPEEKKLTVSVEETTSQTKHVFKLRGISFDYTVTTGTIVLKEEDLEEGEEDFTDE